MPGILQFSETYSKKVADSDVDDYSKNNQKLFVGFWTQVMMTTLNCVLCMVCLLFLLRWRKKTIKLAANARGGAVASARSVLPTATPQPQSAV